MILVLSLDFPNAVAFSVLADEQSFFLKGFGYAFYRPFRLSDGLGHLFLCRVRILLQEFQDDDFL